MSNTRSDEVRFLLDEDVSPNIVPPLWDEGVDAVALRDRSKLRAPDYRVLQFAHADARAVATINLFDFEKLLKKRQDHFGVAVIPSGGNREEQFDWLLAIAHYLRSQPDAMGAIHNRIVSIDEDLKINSRFVHAPPISVVVQSTTTTSAPR